MNPNYLKNIFVTTIIIHILSIVGKKIDILTKNEIDLATKKTVI